MPIALMVAAGCSKAEIQRRADTAAASIVRTDPAAITISTDGAASEFEKVCQELPGMSEVPVVVNTDEYPKLIEFIKAQSPLVAADSDRILLAHTRALKLTNTDVMMLLEQNQKFAELSQFKRNVGRFIHYKHPSLISDLTVMVTKVMELNEGGKCASAYMSHFFSNFVKELDVFGELTIGLTESRAQDDTLLLQAPLPDELRNAQPARLQGITEIVTLPKLERSPQLDVALRALETGYTAQNYRVILFDLRYAKGVEVPVLAQIKASAARGWGILPVVIWTNRQTRGIAALVAQQLSAHPNVLVIGSSDETYGWGRKLVQQSATLTPGLSPITLTIGSEFLQPQGMSADSDGYRLHLPADHLLDKDKIEAAIDRAEQWSSQAPQGDFGQALAQSDGNNSGGGAQEAGISASGAQIADTSGDPASAQQQAQAQPQQPADPSQQQAQPQPQLPQQPDPTQAPPPVTPPAGAPMNNSSPFSF